MEQSKVCNTCLQTKPVFEFGNDKTRKSGKESKCLICRRKQRAIYRNENKPAIKIQQADNYQRNRLKRIEAANLYAKNNPKKKNAHSKKWRDKNHELMAHYQRQRRAKKLQNGIYLITQKDLKRLYAKPCIYCGSEERIEIDHVIAIAKGGVHGVGNLVPACKKCNASKQDLFIMEWRLKKN